MNATFVDLNNNENPANGTVISAPNIRKCVRDFQCKTPSMFQLQLQSGVRIEVGVAGDMGCIQYTPANGLPPYVMATTSLIHSPTESYVIFSVGGTDTPISDRFCLPIELLVIALEHIIIESKLFEGLFWEEV